MAVAAWWGHEGSILAGGSHGYANTTRSAAGSSSPSPWFWGQCSYNAIFDIMGEEKKAEMDRVTIKNDVLRKYFPRSYTPKQMQDTIIKLLEQWQKKRQRSQER